MPKIRLYNSETETRRQLFAAVLHEIIVRQYMETPIIELTTNHAVNTLPFDLQGTEHVALLGDNEAIYGRSYLAISTSPEAGINRRLNRIIQLSHQSKTVFIKRALFALAIECPRLCINKVDETAKILGNRGIQFEFWEAKDVRRQISARMGVECPAFETSHLIELASSVSFSCPSTSQISNVKVTAQSKENKEVDDNISTEKLGTLFVSYSSEDRGFVDKLVSLLDQHAWKVWYDRREVVVGDSIIDKVNAGLSEAVALVAVLSKSSVKKPWVLREINSSLERQLQSTGFQVLPVLMEKCELPPLIADIKYADFSQSFEAGFNELIAGLQGRRRSI
jgi:hypothetical protein